MSKLSEFDIVNIENDDVVANYLHHLGMDIDYPFLYVANKHRNAQGDIVTGFRCCGEVRIDVEYRQGDIIGMTEQLICAAYNDVSKMEEMAELSFKVRNWEDHVNDNDSISYDEERALFPIDQLEPDWEDEEAKIAALQNILLDIRGTPYTSSGALKTMQDYKEFADCREMYKEKYDV